jgi:hypothetical protein
MVYFELAQAAFSSPRSLQDQIVDALAEQNLNPVRMLVRKFLAQRSISSDALTGNCLPPGPNGETDTVHQAGCSFGRITNVQTDPRAMEFALKLFF